MARLVLLTLCLALFASGCTLDEFVEETPGWRVSNAVMETCIAAEREPTEDLTSDLASDLVGGWRQPMGGSHPLTTLASSPQVLVFEADGTGQIWWTHRATTLSDGGSLEFEWRVEDGHLIVNDLPPAEVIQGGSRDVRIRPAGDTDLSNAVAWFNCGESLRVPEDS